MTVTKARHLLVTEAGIDLNSFNFGYPHTRTTFNSYILQLPNGDYSIYRPWQWNHLCFAWSEGGKSKMVLVQFFLIKYRVFHLLRDLGWVDFPFLMFHCLPNSAWADGNQWVESTKQLHNTVEHPNPSQPNPGLRADETLCTVKVMFQFCVFTEWRVPKYKPRG